MNRVWVSGRIVDAPPPQGSERVLIIQTFEATPKRILTKYRGDNPLEKGDVVESYGELGEQEPVVVGGQTVKALDGRVAMRNVYYALVIYRLLPADSSASGAVHSQSGSRANVAAPAAQSKAAGPLTNREVNDVRGPELPWS